MKKSISIVIAIMLLINVFAVSAFAAVPDGNAIALTLSSDKESYSAGETVMVTLSVETIADVAGISAGEVEIAYNSAIFTPAKSLDDGALALSGDGSYGCTLGEIIETNYDPTGSFIKKGKAVFYDSDKSAYGWNAGLHFCVAENFKGITYIDCSQGSKVFIKFPIKIVEGTPNGKYVIGVNKAAFEDLDNAGYAYLVDEDFGGISGDCGLDFGLATGDATFACDTLEIVVGTGEGGSGDGGDTPDPTTPVVSNNEVQVKWANKLEGQLYIGLCGYLNDFTVETDADKTVTNLYEIGFRMSTSDESLTSSYTDVPAYTLYDFETGGYQFRAVVGGENLTYDADVKIYGTAYIQLTADSEKILATEKKISTTVAAEYNEAITDKGMPAFGA